MPWPGMAEKRPCCHAVGAARQMLHFPLLIPEASSYVVQRIFQGIVGLSEGPPPTPTPTLFSVGVGAMRRRAPTRGRVCRS